MQTKNNTSGLVNLKSRTPEQRKEIARKGALATNKQRKERATLKEQLKTALSLPIKNREIKRACIEEGYEPTQAGNLIRNVVQRAGKNAMMFRTLAEILGELQPQTVNVNVLASASDTELTERMKNITIEADNLEP